MNGLVRQNSQSQVPRVHDDINRLFGFVKATQHILGNFFLFPLVFLTQP
jgi:hypothetical protein